MVIIITVANFTHSMRAAAPYRQYGMQFEGYLHARVRGQILDMILN